MNKVLIVLGVFLFTVSGAFASEEFIFVTVTAESCATCQKLKPIVEKLENEYSNEVKFVTLDVSSRIAIEESKKTAEELGISDFFLKSLNALPRVGIVCLGGEKVQNSFIGETNIETYRESLNKLLAEPNQICSL